MSDNESSLIPTEHPTCRSVVGSDKRPFVIAAGYYELVSDARPTLDMSFWYADNGKAAAVIRRCLGGECVRYGGYLDSVAGTMDGTQMTPGNLWTVNKPPQWQDEDGSGYRPLLFFAEKVFFIENSDGSWTFHCRGPDSVCKGQGLKIRRKGGTHVPGMNLCPSSMDYTQCSGSISAEVKNSDCVMIRNCLFSSVCNEGEMEVCLGDRSFQCGSIPYTDGESSAGESDTGNTDGQSTCHMAEALNSCDLSLKYNPNCYCSVSKQTCKCDCQCGGL